MKGLNDRHRIFINEYIKNGLNARNAYLVAYPNCKVASADGSAHRLLKNKEIQTEIKKQQDKYLKKQITTIQQRQKILSDIIFDEEIDNKDRIKAIDLLNEMSGAYA